MEKKHNIVYKTVNLINNKIYIGVHATNNLDDGYLGSGKFLLKAIKKYGKENFKRYILHDFITIESAYGVEEVIVNKYFILRDDNYNTAVGGGLPFKDRHHTEESKQKMSIIKKGISRCPHTKETKYKMSLSKKGIPHTKEHNNKISLARKGIPNGRKGIAQPQISGSKNGMARKVLCITTGEVFDCIIDAVQKYPSAVNICACCKCKRNYTGKLPDGTKLQWQYV